MEYNKEITRSDLEQLETYLDRLYSRLGIDVVFQGHFIDRVHDARGGKPITLNDLRRLFKQSYKYNGKKIAQLGQDEEEILKDALDVFGGIVLRSPPSRGRHWLTVNNQRILKYAI